MERKKGGRRRLVLAVGLVLVTALSLGSAPAKADCVSAEVYYWRLGSGPYYVIGPKHCVVSTPWPGFTWVGPVQVGPSSVVRVGLQVWIPAPI